MRTKCKLAGLALALSLAIPVGVSTAPAAEAATLSPIHLHVSDNKKAFNAKPGIGAFEINVTAHYPSGKAVHGKARLYINGIHVRGLPSLRGGRITFVVPRSKLRDNRESRIKVRILPWDQRQPDKIVTRTVIDRPASGAAVVALAKRQVGKPYVYGASGPSSFDCSGLVQYAYREATGKRLPHSSSAIRDAGRRVSRPSVGDIVWTPGHVAIYAGNNKVVEAATPRTDVVYRTMWQSNPVFVRL